MDKKITNKMPLSFSAISPETEVNVISPTESELNNVKFIQWGDKNLYPSFIYECYKNSPTLKTIIKSFSDYVVGENITSVVTFLTNEKLEDVVRFVSDSYAIWGGFALNILRNKFGGIADIIPLDLRKLRVNKDKSLFYYSEDFYRKSYGRAKYTVYPKFDKNDIKQYSSVYYYSNNRFQVYPSPIWSASVQAAIAEAKLGDYHLNSLNNNFAGNTMVCLNNGVPTDDVQEEIEENFNEKFCGVENSGRVVISYSADKDHAPTIESIKTDDYAERYKSLNEWCSKQLFVAFRANPNLVGISTESNGFNSEEYTSSFKLFNRTVIQPVQKIICNSFVKIFGEENVISIEPFTITAENEKTIE